MIAFHSLFPEIAQREVRCIHVLAQPGNPPGSGLSAGEYAFVEFYCEDLNCDCRRVFVQVIARHQQDRVLASINYGWEAESFYRRKMPHDPDAAREIVTGALDPINAQSGHAPELLRLFQQCVLDGGYRARLRRHYQLFREEIRRHQTPATEPGTPGADAMQTATAARRTDGGIPPKHRERFAEVAALLEAFGQKHLDPELTGFALELWKRVCRRKVPECLRGEARVWAASVTHVIARMNFLFDRAQPVHLTFDTICDFFQTNKTTVGGKATAIERNLRLRQHSEPGLCRREFLEDFTILRHSSGLALPWKIAKQMGYLPPGARLEDFL